jgi:hypothetical protein
MKYAIRDTYWWFDTKDYIDHKDAEWVKGISTAKFKERPKTPRAIHTTRLSKAKLYNSSAEATAVANLIGTPECPASVVEVSDKTLFQARLRSE